MLFHKGVLLKDTEELVQQTKNVQSARQIRIKNNKEIEGLETDIKRYIFEAIEVEKAGLEVKMKKTSDFEMSNEFKKALAADSDLKSTFEALTPARQRGYLLYFSDAKQSKTRVAHIEKYKQKILDGKGSNDRAKKLTGDY